MRTLSDMEGVTGHTRRPCSPATLHTCWNFLRRGGLVLALQLEHVLDGGGPPGTDAAAVARLLLLLPPSRILVHFPHFPRIYFPMILTPRPRRLSRLVDSLLPALKEQSIAAHARSTNPFVFSDGDSTKGPLSAKHLVNVVSCN